MSMREVLGTIALAVVGGIVLLLFLIVCSPPPTLPS